MIPGIVTLSEKKLIGKRMKMSLVNNSTVELWRSFMSKRSEIQNKLSSDLYSVQVYDDLYFDNFDPNKEFEKWATIEVKDFETIPDGMESFVLPGGLYAVFLHKGSRKDNSTFQFIFTTWLPNSGFLLDHRPHFEVLGEKYKNEDPGSEEDLWIPIRANR